jgi:L-amino acid N-acyltransferase
MNEATIRDAEDRDLESITAIQNAFISSTAIEWTDVEHSVDDRRIWLDRHRRAGYPVVVAVATGDVVGFASFGDFRDSTKWPGYRLTVENTIHVRDGYWGAGIGRRLMNALVERATGAGIHVMIAAVDGENVASIRFHERLGFTEVARMPQVGTKFGRWLDLVLLQRVLSETPPPPR